MNCKYRIQSQLFPRYRRNRFRNTNNKRILKSYIEKYFAYMSLNGLKLTSLSKYLTYLNFIQNINLHSWYVLGEFP